MLRNIIVIAFTLNSICNSMPDIFCDPFFGTITRLVNGSYFVADEVGNYWIAGNDDKLTNINRKGNIRYLIDEDNVVFNASKVFTFDLTFIVNFDHKCNAHQEHFYGFKFLHGLNTTYTKYHSSKWQAMKKMTQENMGSDFLAYARAKVSPSRRIGAILSVKSVGIILFQDSDVTYVYCNSSSGWKWDDQSQYVHIKYSDALSLSEIHGGFVDNDNRVAYLFPGERSSSNNYIRKVFYKCDIQIEKKPNVTLNCVRHTFKSLCVLPSFWQKYMIIIIALIVIVSIIILSVCIGLCYYFLTRERKPEDLKPPEDEKIELQRVRRF